MLIRTHETSDTPLLDGTSISAIFYCRYTSVTVQILSKERIRNDLLLGSVVLGYGSTTNEERVHWSKVLNNLDTDVEQNHNLQSAAKSLK